MLIYHAISQPTPIEKKRLIHQFSQIDLKAEHKPAEVLTGLSIKNFREFDMVANSFIFEGIVWFECDPALVSLDTLSRFSFEKGTIQSVSYPHTYMRDGRLLVEFNIVVKCSNEFNYALFPFDDHLLSIVLVNTSVSPQEVIFKSFNQTLTSQADTVAFGWKEYYKQTFAGYVKHDLDQINKDFYVANPAVQFSIFYGRSGLKYALIILMPMIVFILIMLTTFSYPSKEFASIIVVNGASLSGLIGFRFVIETVSPKVGYFMISDLLFITFLAIAACLFLVGIFAEHMSLIIKKAIIIGTDAIVIGFFGIITWHVLSFALQVPV